MAVHLPVTQPGIYFITFTSYQWLPLIEKTRSYDMVYKSFDVLKSHGNYILGYVIMPNHLHLLLYYTNEGNRSLNLEIGSCKRFIAYEIVKRLKTAEEYSWLQKLERAVEPKDKSRGKLHEVWQDSFDCKECRTERFVLQKLQYMHRNPLAERWQLAKSSIDYLHSSASFYITGRHSAYPVRDYREALALLQLDQE